VIVCEHCTKTTTLTTSKRACAECGANYRALLEGVGLEASPAEQEEEEVSHPWRSLRPYYYEPIRGA
jgi:rRNA maturation endonuclease Nob1